MNAKLLLIVCFGLAVCAKFSAGESDAFNLLKELDDEGPDEEETLMKAMEDEENAEDDEDERSVLDQDDKDDTQLENFKDEMAKRIKLDPNKIRNGICKVCSKWQNCRQGCARRRWKWVRKACNFFCNVRNKACTWAQFLRCTKK